MCAERFDHWRHVPCVVDGHRLSREELAKQIWDTLEPELVNKGVSA